MNDGSPLKISGNKNVDQLALEKLDGNQARIREFGNLGNTHKILTDGDGMIRDIGNLCDPGGMRDHQMFRNRRADHLNTLRRR